ncbi:hypothetical protein SADUNF_Sadunf07G0046600 [Salix dunnii]|uniref:Uncharacterized protein n=1 Tax=Salix dunnii TaxID=1413687 RepID=A0A835JZW6_9ROSI|nr:hypothetical protein SADUNF_Sadunf07G0046600 [Salix dunnii]
MHVIVIQENSKSNVLSAEWPHLEKALLRPAPPKPFLVGILFNGDSKMQISSFSSVLCPNQKAKKELHSFWVLTEYFKGWQGWSYIRAKKHKLTVTTYQTMRNFSLLLFILFMILLVTKPNLISCRALRSGRKNETNDHHEATEIDDHGFGSVSTNTKDSVYSEPVKDAGGDHASATGQQSWLGRGSTYPTYAKLRPLRSIHHRLKIMSTMSLPHKSLLVSL